MSDVTKPETNSATTVFTTFQSDRAMLSEAEGAPQKTSTKKKGFEVVVKDYFASVTPKLAESRFAQSYYHKPLDTGRMSAEAYEYYPMQ